MAADVLTLPTASSTAIPPGMCRAPQAAFLAGISYRQLDWWDRTGRVQPTRRPASGSGTRRLYTVDDVLRLAVYRCLFRHGLAPLHADELVDELLTTGRAVRATAHTVQTITVDIAALLAAITEQIGEVA